MVEISEVLPIDTDSSGLGEFLYGLGGTKHEVESLIPNLLFPQ